MISELDVPHYFDTSDILTSIQEVDCVEMQQYGNLLFWDINTKKALRFFLEDKKQSHVYSFGNGQPAFELKIDLNDDGDCMIKFSDENNEVSCRMSTDASFPGGSDCKCGSPGQVTKNILYDIFDDSRAMVKSTLMNQEIIYGIGNEFSDEILYQAGIYPKKKSSQLSDYDKEAVFDCIEEVYDLADKHRSSIKEYPKSSITPRRYKGVGCPMCAGRIAKMKVSGYNCFYCKDHQHG